MVLTAGEGCRGRAALPDALWCLTTVGGFNTSAPGLCTPQAVVATAELHSPAEAAQRVVPAVAPLAADPIEDVRSHALAALDCFVKQLRAAHTEQTARAREEGDAGKAGLPGAYGHPNQADDVLRNLPCKQS